MLERGGLNGMRDRGSGRGGNAHGEWYITIKIFWKVHMTEVS